MAFQVFTILTGVVVGWVKKGSIWSIIHMRLKAIWLLPIAYVLQHVSIANLTGVAYEVVLLFSYISIVVFCVLNLRVPGLIWTLGGTVANFVVMLANGLRMPAYVPAVAHLSKHAVALLMTGDYGKSVAMSNTTHLNFLGDIFSFEVKPASLISIGDILFAVGLVILIQYAMRLEGRDSQHVRTADSAN